jgi:Uncharacterised BCR, YnfA/UPF0060 family
VVRFLPQPQRASPPRQLELSPSGAAEFVICDHTIDGVIPDTYDIIGGLIALLGVFVIMYWPR